MIAFYLSLVALVTLGAAGAAFIRQLAAAQARQRGALRPVPAHTAGRGADHRASRG